MREYAWLGGLLLAMVADADADAASPRLLWVHSDHLGTPQRLTDATGALVWDAVLEPFGEVAQLVTSLVDQPLRLPGQYADAESGLRQNWWRDYDPSLGRYLQPDPLGLAAGVSLYGYANGDPLSYVDPDGQNPAAAITACAGNPACVAAVLGIGCAATPGCRQAIADTCTLAYDAVGKLFDDTFYNRKSDKEAATDKPSWAEGEKPMPGEAGKDFAERLMEKRYGKGAYSKGSREFSQLKKYGDRNRSRSKNR